MVSKKEIERTKKVLEKNGFSYDPKPGDDGRKFFKRIIHYKSKERRVHVHLTFLGGGFWESFLAFRDYLRTHHDLRDEYSRIKKEGVAYAQGDAQKYRSYKKSFFKRITG